MKWRFLLGLSVLAVAPAMAAATKPLPLPPAVAAPRGLYATCENPQGPQLWIGSRDGKTIEEDIRFGPSKPWQVLSGTRVLTGTELAKLNAKWWAAGNIVWAAESGGDAVTAAFAPGTRPATFHTNSLRPSIVIRHANQDIGYCAVSALPASAAAIAWSR